MKVGVISDTHGFLDPPIASLFDGVEHILHGGDVGLGIVTALEQIAPVTAVLGNTDVGLDLRETEVVTLGGVKFLLHHIVDPAHLHDGIAGRVAAETPRVIVYGHTHKPYAGEHGGILYFNPGYAGRQRFKLARSVAILEVDGGPLRHRFLEL